jgi:hypothetical protein
MGSLFQIGTVNFKTPRMSHRYSLTFEGLDAVIARAQASQLTFLNVNGSSQNIFTRLAPAAGDTGSTMSRNLELSLLSVTVPPIEMETVEVSRFHDTAKHISKFTTMGDMNVTFYDYVDGSASAILFIWQSLVGDKRTGAISYKGEYILAGARLTEYGPKAPAQTEGAEYILAEHQMVNIYPKSIDLGEHSYEGAEVRKVQVTFSIDNIYPLYYRGSVTDPNKASDVTI